MKVKYFEDTDTLFVGLTDAKVSETKELNENLYVDIDSEGKVVSLTIEHAKASSGKLDFSYETIGGLKKVRKRKSNSLAATKQVLQFPVLILKNVINKKLLI